MPGWGPALPQSALRAAAAVLISLLLILAGGGVQAVAYGDDREEGTSSSEFAPSDECVTSVLLLPGSAVRAGRRVPLPTGPATPVARLRLPLLVPRADAAPACATRAGHTVLRC
ncbi:hypothetical protein [Streptomyces sp. NPDC051162]|uniref:hypothetical protein n=1 Tax=unclassified Streptomyces TaxID=2593676 RepID=UPI00343CF320